MIKGVHLASSKISGFVPCSKQKLKIFTWPPELAQCIIFRPESSVEFNFLSKKKDNYIIMYTYLELLLNIELRKKFSASLFFEQWVQNDNKFEIDPTWSSDSHSFRINLISFRTSRLKFQKQEIGRILFCEHRTIVGNQ